MKSANGRGHVNVILRRIFLRCLLLSLFSLGILWTPVHGQGNVDAFTCFPNNQGRYCRDQTWDDATHAFGGWHCSNWSPLGVGGVHAYNDEFCENGASVNNTAQVGNQLTYVDGYIESDSWGPVLRTLTSKAGFCDDDHTIEDIRTVEYPEGCNAPTPTPTPSGGGGGCVGYYWDYDSYCADGLYFVDLYYYSCSDHSWHYYTTQVVSGGEDFCMIG